MRDFAIEKNNLSLVADVVETLADAQIKTWLFGGWAEELTGFRPHGPHRDIDLLYPALNFDILDDFLTARRDVEEVQSKRFVHKRAFLWHGVLVEVFLLRPEAAGHVTDFFCLYRFRWPQDALSHTARLPSGEWPSASPAALRLYRERHGDVEEAYRRHVTQSDTARMRHPKPS